MKKFLIGVFIGLIALFGITSTSSGTEYFLENMQVKNAVVKDQEYNLYFYLDNSINFSIFTENLGYAIDEMLEYDPGDFEVYYYDNQNNLISSNLGFLVYDYTSSNQTISFYIEEINSNNITIEAQFHLEIDLGGNNKNIFFVTRNNLNNSWFGYIYNENSEIVNTIPIKGFKLVGSLPYDDQYLQTINQDLEPFIGTQTSLSPLEPTPEPTPDSMESSIGNVIRGIIDWFVDIFNGLADAFVIVDSTGEFVGFTVWGQVLFIEVGIGLVILVLKWVIGLIRGV